MNPEDLAAMIETMTAAASALAQASDARELAEARKAAEVCAFWLTKAAEAA